nr:histidine phosphatase family protein [uncultured Gellertiella sp.]
MPFLPPPPSRLYLMRHAQSGWALPGQTDFDRSLDETGVMEASLIATRAEALGYRPEILLVSTARRCRDTARSFLAAFAEPPEAHYFDDLYNAPPLAYYEVISRHAARRSVMVLGHNPAMEEILETLVGQNVATATAPDGYPTAGFAVLSQDREAEATDPFLLTDFLRR